MLETNVGAVSLRSAVMTASGTAGYGDELSEYGALGELGALVTKSLSSEPWAGNAAPRVTEVDAGMLNSVGLQGPGVAAWLERGLPDALAAGARVVASIWGTSVAGYGDAARALSGHDLLAIEVNISCPNVEDRSQMFGHSPEQTARVVEACKGPLPIWVKLSPNVADLVGIARAAVEAGADALVCTNTLLGMALHRSSGKPVLGNGGGGLSGPAVHPVAVRAVYECRRAFPEIPIIGVGGVNSGAAALEFLHAGAQAVQVGTASFRDPRAPWKVARGLERELRRAGHTSVRDAIGAAHRS
jgi:dihydroorotate dehydrogenase (NAD+) catalytic subunit